ncbi:MAG: SRPBCC domain-containing protein [Bryobacteraceae bacterium]
MKSFQAAARIRATPDTIWRILTDASSYPRWNPTVKKIDGRIAAGEKIALEANGRTFKLKVSEFEPSKKMIWEGGMPLGLFKGTRTYTLTPQADGSVEFFMREEFSGLMSPLIEKSLPDLQPQFEQFAASLKQHAENQTKGAHA